MSFGKHAYSVGGESVVMLSVTMLVGSWRNDVCGVVLNRGGLP